MRAAEILKRRRAENIVKKKEKQQRL